MVLGTPTTETPASAARRAATPRVSSPPIAIRASMRSRCSVSSTRATPSSAWNGLVRDVPRMVPPRWIRPRVRADGELHRLAVDHAPPAVTEADQLVAVHRLALAHDGADDRVEPRTVASAGEHPDAHGHQCVACVDSVLACDPGASGTRRSRPASSRLFRGRHYRQVAVDRRARRRHARDAATCCSTRPPTTSSSPACATACCCRCSRPTPTSRTHVFEFRPRRRAAGRTFADALR